MNKKSILSGLYMACCVTLCYGMQFNENKKESELSETERYLLRLKRSEVQTLEGEQSPGKWPKKADISKGMACAAAGHLAGLIFVYREDSDVKSYIDAKSESTKHLLLKKAVLPVAFKVGKIKDEGISVKDLLKVTVYGAGIYGLKKTGDYFNIWQAIKGDITKTKEAASFCMRYVANHKLKVTLLGMGIAAALGCLKLGTTLRKNADVALVDQFFLSLTAEQRKKLLFSPELAQLIDQVSSDPLSIALHDELMKLFTKRQKELLERIVEEYMTNNPHLALADEGL